MSDQLVTIKITPLHRDLGERIAAILIDSNDSMMDALLILSIAIWSLSLDTNDPSIAMQGAREILDQLSRGCPICGKHETHAHGPNDSDSGN